MLNVITFRRIGAGPATAGIGAVMGTLRPAAMRTATKLVTMRAGFIIGVS